MKCFEEKAEIMSKFLCKIGASGSSCHVKGDIPPKKIESAIKKWAAGLDKDTVIGFCDTSAFENGKSGCIFTSDKIYYSELLEKPKKLWYDDIKSFEIQKPHKKDCDRVLVVKCYDDTIVTFTSPFINKTPLKEFLEIMNNFDVPKSSGNMLDYFKNSTINYGATAGGLGISTYENVNKQFEEEKFHARQGHGFAAERANTLYDKLTGHDAKILGDDNAKNGADRIVDGVYIQSKYCATASDCINGCFENNGKGGFKYLLQDGNYMQIEVPSDKYDEAIKVMQEKIRQGQVSGVSDSNEAIKIVRKGHFTYEQAKNIAKAGTVESLAYDSVTGIITALSAFGVTSIITLATAIWNGESFGDALKIATYSGLKVGGIAFITSIIASQLSKAGLNSALVGSSEAIIAIMGPKASAILINAFRAGAKPIYGAAAMKSAAKLLRGNAITAGVTFVVLSTFDVANIFRGRISGKQLFKNLTSTAATVGGGTGGWIGGATAGAAIGSAVPVIGTAVGGVVGGIIGSMAGGAIAGKVTDSFVGIFIEDDAEQMVKTIESVFIEMTSDYLLNQKEAEKSADRLKDILDGKKLKDMFASDDRKKFARDMLVPIIENEISKRDVIPAIDIEYITNSLKVVLEEIADESSDGRVTGFA